MQPPSGVSSLDASVQAGIATVRATAKWIVGGVAATAAGVIVGGPLTEFGALGLVEDRFWIAICGAALGFVALAALLWLAIQVLVAEYVSVPMVQDEARVNRRDREKLERALRNDFPLGLKTFKQLQDVLDEVRAKKEKTDEEKHKEQNLVKAYPEFMPRLCFEYIKLKFSRLQSSGGIAAALTVIGFGAFAWAANPPADNVQITTPHVVRVRIHPDDMTLLREKVGARCAVSEPDAIALNTSDAGLVDLVIVPIDERCGTARFFMLGGRLFDR